ncbi:hypothetical protein DUI87_11256 [Hirundo rustica rustica]|uniref:Uncharacterized protein n=1 Tax=Hirundo rustica rustica TaxID=333673 RepID=A0A3M0KHN5_HIRRU|nr:hypothetical protein DUI87_11256 [Hirundo rustica rustica]
MRGKTDEGIRKGTQEGMHGGMKDGMLRSCCHLSERRRNLRALVLVVVAGVIFRRQLAGSHQVLSIPMEKASLLLPLWGELGSSPEEQRFGNTPEAFRYSRHWDGKGGGERESFLQDLH